MNVQGKARKSGFTLIELLVVIAIVAVLAVVVILVVNPAGLLQQARDSNRLSDLATMSVSLGYFKTDQPTAVLGTASTSYISVPDPSATSTAGDQCQGLGLMSLGSSSWQCGSSSTVRKADSTGWIPVNFSLTSYGTPLTQLPQDPTNVTSSGLFYSYSTNGSQYEVTALLESSKQRTQLTTNPQVAGYPEVAAQGSSLSLSPLWNSSGLVGWWPMDEGSGSSTLDQSGGGSVGTWNGTAPYYAVAKVGNYGGSFDGSTDYLDVANQTPFTVGTGNFSVIAWVNPSLISGNRMVVKKGDYAVGGYVVWVDSTGAVNFTTNDGTNVSLASPSGAITVGNWAQIAISVNRTGTTTIAVNGAQLTTSGSVRPGSINIASDVQVGHSSPAISYFQGIIDDVRLYNRALSAAEVQALYNAEH